MPDKLKTIGKMLSLPLPGNSLTRAFQIEVVIHGANAKKMAANESHETDDNSASIFSVFNSFQDYMNNEQQKREVIVLIDYNESNKHSKNCRLV